VTAPIGMAQAANRGYLLIEEIYSMIAQTLLYHAVKIILHTFKVNSPKLK
jgi:hypothetical protein